jgi:predicted DNA-binding transcriptional regulator AlpA
MTRWLSLPHAAEHLDISVDSLRRLVRQGKLPQPDRSLGTRLPRWDKEALDKAMHTDNASNASETDRALEIWLEKQKQRPRRAAHAR